MTSIKLLSIGLALGGIATMIISIRLANLSTQFVEMENTMRAVLVAQVHIAEQQAQSSTSYNVPGIDEETLRSYGIEITSVTERLDR